MKYYIASIDRNQGSMDSVDPNTKEVVKIEWDNIELDVYDPNTKTYFGFPTFEHHKIPVSQFNKANPNIPLDEKLKGVAINIEYGKTKSGRAILKDCSILKQNN